MRNVITGVGNLLQRRRRVWVGTRVLLCRGARAYTVSRPCNVVTTSSAEFYASQKKGFYSSKGTCMCIRIESRWQIKFTNNAVFVYTDLSTTAAVGL